MHRMDAAYYYTCRTFRGVSMSLCVDMAVCVSET